MENYEIEQVVAFILSLRRAHQLCMFGLHIFANAFYTICGGGEIAQSLASLSIKRAARVRSQLGPLVIER